MDPQVKKMLDRQAAWQRGRSRLSWEEKLQVLPGALGIAKYP